MKRRVRHNTDERTRDLEKQAAAGSLEAQSALFMARVRSGEVTPEEVEQLALGCDRIALRALGEVCGDRAVLQIAGSNTKFDSQSAEAVIRAWYRAGGYAPDPLSSAGSLLSRDGQTKIAFQSRVWQKFTGGRGHWFKAASGSLPKLAEVLVAKARSRVHRDQTAVPKLKEKRAKEKATAGKRKQTASAAGLVLRMAVVEAARQLTPEGRREIALGEDGGRYSRQIEDLLEKVSPPDDATEASIDARLSIETPPVPLREGHYKVRGVRVSYSGQHTWHDSALGKPVRVWREGSGRSGFSASRAVQIGVEIGTMPVDPFSMTMSKAGMARSMVGRDHSDGVTGSLRTIDSTDADRKLWVGFMFLIVVAQKRSGAGLRYLRAWCRLLQAYGTEPRWIAQAVGDEGNAWLAGLEKRGEIETGPKVGSDLVVECLAPAGPGPADAPGQLGLFSNPPRGDDRLRDLERQAAHGDPEAQAALEREAQRRGRPPTRRGRHPMPHMSTVLGRDETGDEITRRWRGKRASGYMLTEEQQQEPQWRNHYTILVRSPDSAALSWKAFHTVEQLHDFVRAYGLSIEGDVVPGGSFYVVIPDDPQYEPLAFNPPRGDDRLRDLERQAAHGDRHAAVQLDVARYRAGAPSVLGWLVRSWSAFDTVHENGRYTPAANVLATREQSRQKEAIDSLGLSTLGPRDYWSYESGEVGLERGARRSDVVRGEIETVLSGPYAVYVGCRDNRRRVAWRANMEKLGLALEAAGHKVYWVEQDGELRAAFVPLDEARIRLAHDLHEPYVAILEEMKRAWRDYHAGRGPAPV